MNQMARCLLALMLTMFATASLATFHTFKIDEIYSNADGTVQYVVLLESQGFDGENLLGVHSLTTTQGTTVTPFPFGTNLPGTIPANKRVLIATPGFAALGIRALLFVGTEPTPTTSYAVKELGAAAGVMVTASHNPPEYNGYKVYWENAAQIIPPVDTRIAAAMARAPAASEIVPPVKAAVVTIVFPVSAGMIATVPMPLPSSHRICRGLSPR